MKNLVLIEDDQFLQELYKELLSQKYQLEIIGDGLSALARLTSGHWDITLVDLTLPGLSGIQVLEELHNKKIKQGKIIVLTNSEDPALLTLAKKYSDGILMKSSINPNELVDKIEAFL